MSYLEIELEFESCPFCIEEYILSNIINDKSWNSMDTSVISAYFI